MALTLKYCAVRYTDWGVETLFEDGKPVGAWAHDTPDYRMIAMRCGYEDDIRWYCQEHEAMHSIVAQYFNDERSCVLYPLALGLPIEKAAGTFEEAMTQMCQRWVRAGERPILGGYDWYDFKRTALQLLGSIR